MTSSDSRDSLLARYAALPQALLARLSAATARWPTSAGRCAHAEDLGEHFGAGLYAREVDYFVAQRMGARPPRTCCGGARKRACISDPRSARR